VAGSGQYLSSGYKARAKSGKQGVLLEMAQSWIRLAEQAKERDDPNKGKGET
jgi:hypothetical protein